VTQGGFAVPAASRRQGGFAVPAFMSVFGGPISRWRYAPCQLRIEFEAAIHRLIAQVDGGRSLSAIVPTGRG
jgi:hypothetical protein